MQSISTTAASILTLTSNMIKYHSISSRAGVEELTTTIE